MVCNTLQALSSHACMQSLSNCSKVASHGSFGRHAPSLGPSACSSARITPFTCPIPRAKRCRGYEALIRNSNRSQGSHRNCVSKSVYATQSRPLTFNQRWRSIKGTVQEQKKRARQAFVSLPPVQAIALGINAITQKLEPLYRLLRLFRAWWKGRVDSYAEFGGEEVKRQWEWRRRTEAERNIWANIGIYLEISLLTVLWMVVTPATVFWGAFLPLLVSWIVYDKQHLSPIFVTLIPMMLLKFPPGYPIRWIL